MTMILEAIGGFGHRDQVADHQIGLGRVQMRTVLHFGDLRRPFSAVQLAGLYRLVAAGATRQEQLAPMVKIGQGSTGPRDTRAPNVGLHRAGYLDGRAPDHPYAHGENRGA